MAHRARGAARPVTGRGAPLRRTHFGLVAALLGFEAFLVEEADEAGVGLALLEMPAQRTPAS